MGRKNNTTKLQLISDNRYRQVVFKKRKESLVKKAYELSVLTGCEVGLIMFSQQGKVIQFASQDIDQTLMHYTNLIPAESRTNKDFIEYSKRQGKDVAWEGDFGGGDDEEEEEEIAGGFSNDPFTTAAAPVGESSSMNVSPTTGVPAVGGNSNISNSGSSPVNSIARLFQQHSNQTSGTSSGSRRLPDSITYNNNNYNNNNNNNNNNNMNQVNMNQRTKQLSAGLRLPLPSRVEETGGFGRDANNNNFNNGFNAFAGAIVGGPLTSFPLMSANPFSPRSDWLGGAMQMTDNSNIVNGGNPFVMPYSPVSSTAFAWPLPPAQPIEANNNNNNNNMNNNNSSLDAAPAESAAFAPTTTNRRLLKHRPSLEGTFSDNNASSQLPVFNQTGRRQSLSRNAKRGRLAV